MIQKQKEEKTKDKKVLSMLILMFPSLLLTLIVDIEPYVKWLGITILIIGWQAIIIKNFLDDYYGE